MFKVAAFVKRNEDLLTHDEYRAGHGGYHNSHSRRMRGMRGYCLNVRANDDLRTELGELCEVLEKGQPPQFDDFWDGFPIVYFDSMEAWRSITPEPDRAGEHGLIEDEDWVPRDGAYLFQRPFLTFHQRLDESIAVPVERPEYKLTKIVQFFRFPASLASDERSQLVLGAYSQILGTLPGLHGCIVNVRDTDIDSAHIGFFPEDHYGFTDEGRAMRRQFCDLWNGFSELWFDSAADFAQARAHSVVADKLADLEDQLFEAVWYRKIDESVVIMPNRGKIPTFYYR